MLLEILEDFLGDPNILLSILLLQARNQELCRVRRSLIADSCGRPFSGVPQLRVRRAR
jgi:hypothetical protein